MCEQQQENKHVSQIKEIKTFVSETEHPRVLIGILTVDRSGTATLRYVDPFTEVCKMGIQYWEYAAVIDCIVSEASQYCTDKKITLVSF